MDSPLTTHACYFYEDENVHDGGEGEDEVKNDIRDDDEDDVPTMVMIMVMMMMVMVFFTVIASLKNTVTS